MESLIQEKEDIRFYLATDDDREREYLIEKFGDRILVNSNCSFDRFSMEGQKSAVIDMICLSKSMLILGSKGSTFSLVASYIGKINLEIIANE